MSAGADIKSHTPQDRIKIRRDGIENLAEQISLSKNAGKDVAQNWVQLAVLGEQGRADIGAQVQRLLLALHPPTTITPQFITSPFSSSPSPYRDRLFVPTCRAAWIRTFTVCPAKVTHRLHRPSLASRLESSLPAPQREREREEKKNEACRERPILSTLAYYILLFVQEAPALLLAWLAGSRVPAQRTRVELVPDHVEIDELFDQFPGDILVQLKVDGPVVAHSPPNPKRSKVKKTLSPAISRPPPDTHLPIHRT